MPKATVEGGASDYQAGAPGDSGTYDLPPEIEAVVEEGRRHPERRVPYPARASKAELVDHAVNVAGVDAEVAQAMTKTELAELITARAVPGD